MSETRRIPLDRRVLVVREERIDLRPERGAFIFPLAGLLISAAIFASIVLFAGDLSATVLVLILAVPGQLAKTTSLDRPALRWFALSTLNSFIANVFRFSALAIAPVTVVVPMIRTFAIFQLGFNFLINRSLESFEPRILVAIAVSVAGAVLLAT
ncbi:MAG: hypothetical protein IH920_02250 [Chloroflexi bacterium]|nr:hypothetical protein [Chloroflexota bacterium]